MPELTKRGPGRGVARDGRPASAIVGEALSRVPSQEVAGMSARDMRYLDLLDAAARGPRRGACSEAARQMIDAGMHPEDIADRFVPALARRMGEEWCSDLMGFAGVTVGCARLQALLRELGAHWRGNRRRDPETGSALIAVAAGENHTLGAVVLAGQLRRAGVSVKLGLGVTPPDVMRAVGRQRFDAVLVSASRGARPETLRSLVEAVSRAGTEAAPPVVIGGSIAELDGDLTATTGADLVTNEATEALEFCGLGLPARGTVQRGPET